MSQLKKTNMKESGKKTEALEKALQHVEDMFDRCVCPFFLLGETLRSITQDNQIKGNKVELGVKVKQLTPEVLVTFTSPDFSTNLTDFIHNDKMLSYKVEGVSVEIKIIHKKFKCLDNLDSLLYKWGDYLIPNPLEDYWKVKGFIE